MEEQHGAACGPLWLSEIWQRRLSQSPSNTLCVNWSKSQRDMFREDPNKLPLKKENLLFLRNSWKQQKEGK